MREAKLNRSERKTDNGLIQVIEGAAQAIGYLGLTLGAIWLLYQYVP